MSASRPNQVALDPYGLIVRSGQADLDEVLYRSGEDAAAEDRLASLYAQGAINFVARDAATGAPLAMKPEALAAYGLEKFATLFEPSAAQRSFLDAKQFVTDYRTMMETAKELPVTVSVAASPFGFRKWVTAA